MSQFLKTVGKKYWSEHTKDTLLSHKATGEDS